MHRFSIGRDASCDIILNDPRISRRHAYLTLSPDGKIHFEDDGSMNGSFLLEGSDRVRITSTYLKPSARLQFGKVQISLAEIMRKIHARLQQER